MAKKSSKQQPKQQNVASLGDTTTAPTTANQSVSTSPVDAHVPATTHLSFFNFITLATTDDIKKFLELASTRPEGKNLGNLWRRAHGEGYEKGRRSLLQNLERKMKDKYEEGVEEGMNLGREQGYTVAKEAFDG
jgi:hypothetical protein